MLINNINITNFKARLMERNISHSNIEVSNEWLNGAISPVINPKLTYKYKKLNFTLDIICKNADELEEVKSKLIKELTLSTIKFSDIQYYYTGFLSEEPELTYVTKGNEIIKYTLLVIAEKEEVTEPISLINNSFTINVNGDYYSPAIVEITPTQSMINLEITGLGEDSIVIKNLNRDEKIILDGISGSVTVNGKNKFADTDLWNFPYLSPGANTITFSKNYFTGIIKYKPRFL